MEEDTSFTTVKTTLNQFCKNDIVKNQLNKVVLNTNKLMFEVYKFANLHILTLLIENKQIPKIDQNFFYKCSCYVSKMYLRKSKEIFEFDKTFSIYKTCYPPEYKFASRDYLGAVINYMDKQMVISSINHLVLNFYKRFSRYIKNKYNLSNEDAYIVCKNIYEKDYSGTNEIIKRYRDILGNEPPYENYVKKDPSKIIKLYNIILTFNLENDYKLFNLLPNKNSYTMSYITIDKTGLKDIISSLKINDFKVADFNENTRSYWEKFFNINNFETKNKNFNFFLTDGKSVSVILETVSKRVKKTRKKNIPESEKYNDINIDDYETIVGIDPGLRYPFVGCNNRNDKIISCSGKQYYHDVGINKVNDSQRRCYKKDEEIASFIKNMPCGKTNNTDDFLIHLKYCLKTLDKALEFHYKNPFRKWKFTKFIKEKQEFNKLCKMISHKEKISEPNKTLVGFGDWSNPRDSIIRGHRRGPVKKLKNELRRWTKVVDVDEYRTSKLCCACHAETEKVSFNGNKINCVLRCKNNECGMVIDRDINGCKNILKVFLSLLKDKKRPLEFQRNTNTSAIKNWLRLCKSVLQSK